MKSYKGLYSKMVSTGNVENCILKASRGKRGRKDVRYILEHLEEYVLLTQEYLDDAVENQTLRLPKHQIRTINDGIQRKKREIISPNFNEQVLHHLMMSVLSPIIYNHMDKGCCGSIPGRGGSRAKYIVEDYIYKHKKDDNTCYCLKLDIQHFFQNINQDKFYCFACKYIRDKKLQYLIKCVLNNYTDHIRNGISYGIPIGFYTSQWFANWYLQGLDSYIRNTLGVECYVRYMDDIVIFGKTSKDLHNIKIKIENYLKSFLDLELNSKWQIFQFKKKDINNFYKTTRPLSFVGYRFYNHKTILRKELMLRATRKAHKLSKVRLNGFVASQMLSYLGWLYSCSMLYCYHKYIEPYINIKVLKKLVSLKNKQQYKAKVKVIKHVQIFEGGYLYATLAV